MINITNNGEISENVWEIILYDDVNDITTTVTYPNNPSEDDYTIIINTFKNIHGLK